MNTEHRKLTLLPADGRSTYDAPVLRAQLDHLASRELVAEEETCRIYRHDLVEGLEGFWNRVISCVKFVFAEGMDSPSRKGAGLAMPAFATI